jgi:shikimate kinase
MATGKTTIGKRLSAKLRVPFLDIDKEVESYLNLSINDIFKTYGENEFRKTEEKVIVDKVITSHDNGFVMSLGGGAFINENIRKLVNSVGISIWLDAKIDIINARIKNSKNERPLTLKFNTKEKLEDLLNARLSYYQKANIKVKVLNTSKENMTKIILEKIIHHIASNNDKN